MQSREDRPQTHYTTSRHSTDLKPKCLQSTERPYRRVHRLNKLQHWSCWRDTPFIRSISSISNEKLFTVSSFYAIQSTEWPRLRSVFCEEKRREYIVRRTRPTFSAHMAVDQVDQGLHTATLSGTRHKSEQRHKCRRFCGTSRCWYGCEDGRPARRAGDAVELLRKEPNV